MHSHKGACRSNWFLFLFNFFFNLTLWEIINLNKWRRKKFEVYLDDCFAISFEACFNCLSVFKHYPVTEISFSYILKKERSWIKHRPAKRRYSGWNIFAYLRLGVPFFYYTLTWIELIPRELPHADPSIVEQILSIAVSSDEDQLSVKTIPLTLFRHLTFKKYSDFYIVAF